MGANAAGALARRLARGHADGIAGLLRDPDAWGFIAETAAREPAGFAELSIPEYANGCDSQPVPFLEGIWVAPQFRRQGAGARLIAHIEAFAIARGFSEIGSDATSKTPARMRLMPAGDFPKRSGWSISAKCCGPRTNALVTRASSRNL